MSCHAGFSYYLHQIPDSEQRCSAQYMGFLRWKSFISWLAYTEVNPLLALGVKGQIREDSAKQYLPEEDRAEVLLCQFEEIYSNFEASKSRKGGNEGKLNTTTLTLLRMSLWHSWVAAFWGLWYTITRFAGPVTFRMFVLWVKDHDKGKGGDEAPVWKGWFWGVLLIAATLLHPIGHHRLFRLSRHVGFRARQALIAAVHAKALRLNTSLLADVTTGKVVNLISNDVRRCDDAYPYLPFLILGPLHLIITMLLVAHELGFVPAIAGIGTTMLLVPGQTFLSKHISRLRTKSANISDERIHLTGQIISGSLPVKMLGWEDALIEKVEQLRKKEQTFLTRMSLIRGGNQALVLIIQPLAAFVAFTVAWAQGRRLEITGAFYALVLLGILKFSMAFFFMAAVEKSAELWVALSRIQQFLSAPEPPEVQDGCNDCNERGTISVTNADYRWTVNHTIRREHPGKPVQKSKTMVQKRRLTKTLKEITFNVQPGELVGVVGRVGSGKTSLLLALLNEMQTEQEGPSMSGSVAYVSQVPWVRAGSVKENILFGDTMDREMYDGVIDACALGPDLDCLPHHDETQLGEQGINLSGGQKARLSLARAAYSRANINLLDDPLSAVDPSVGRSLFDKCIGHQGVMKQSTRVLVTHQRQFLPQCDRVAILRYGRVVAFAPWEHLKAEGYEEVGGELSRAESEVSLASAGTSAQSEEGDIKTGTNSEAKKNKEDIIEGGGGKDSKLSGVGQMIEMEGKVSGDVSWRVYGEYAVCIGIWCSIAAVVLCALATLSTIASEWWISEWVSADDEDQKRKRWIWTFMTITLLIIGISLLFELFTFATMVRGSGKLHNQMLRSVVRSPLRFFHANPTGRIVNRFAKDQGQVDDLLPNLFVDVMALLALSIATIVLIIVAIPLIIPLFLILLVIFIKINKKYVMSSREVRRYEGMTRSPIYATFAENLKGLSSIRAYCVQKQFETSFLAHMDSNGAWWYSFVIMSRWIGFRLDIINAVFVSGAVLIALLLSNSVSPQYVALGLSRLLQLGGALQWGIRQSAELENLMTSVERMLEYTHLEQEPSRVCDGGKDPGSSWPKTGALSYRGLSASYRPELEPVLKRLTFDIPGGSSVGIVGRTGSGKSSLMLTLFRLIDVNCGCITIDGVDIGSIGIDALRNELAIIPQDPILFSGSIRTNLDPQNAFSDFEIWKVLSLVQLTDVVDKAGGLYSETVSEGDQFSTGEKQLVCLARALLKDATIVALDEATANVDLKTDAMIQTMLRVWVDQKRAVGGKVPTVLTIAHRIDTIMDCDLLLVLDGGELIEFGSPTKLMSMIGGKFSGMVEAAHIAAVPPFTITEDN